MTTAPRSRRRALPIALALTALALISIGLLAWYLNTPRGYARSVFFTIPAPAASQEVGRVIRDWAEGPQCPYASLSAAYLTDAPWSDVAEFYQGYMRRAGWGQVERRISGRDIVANTDLEVIDARWPFAGDHDRRSLRLTITNFNNLPITPPQTSQTLFTVEVEYIPDFDFFRSSHLCQD